MKDYFNLFKLEYDWYEGEHEEMLLSKDVELKEFDRDLIESKNFAISLIGKKVENNNFLGKGYAVECLPEFYQQIIWFLINKKGYIKCSFNEDFSYRVEDHFKNNKEYLPDVKEII